MWRILFILSVLPIVAALFFRWQFGLRVLSKAGKRPCRCDPGRWERAVGLTPAFPGAEAPAVEFGKQLRLTALADWKKRAPKQAAARENTRRFGFAVPPFALIISVFAILLAKVPVYGGIAILLASTALAAAYSLITLGAELRAIAVTARNMRESRVFSRSDDEEAVASSAVAHAWCESIPPILKWM